MGGKGGRGRKGEGGPPPYIQRAHFVEPVPLRVEQPGHVAVQLAAGKLEPDQRLRDDVALKNRARGREVIATLNDDAGDHPGGVEAERGGVGHVPNRSTQHAARSTWHAACGHSGIRGVSTSQHTAKIAVTEWVGGGWWW